MESLNEQVMQIYQPWTDTYNERHPNALFQNLTLTCWDGSELKIMKSADSSPGNSPTRVAEMPLVSLCA